MNYLGTVQLAGDFSGDLAAESFLTEKIATILANIATEENHSPNLNIKKGALFEG